MSARARVRDGGKSPIGTVKVVEDAAVSDSRVSELDSNDVAQGDEVRCSY